MTYASIVSRYSVIILILLANLNVLDVQCAYVQNYYINANPKERVQFYDGKDFEKYWGKLVIVVISLYGLKGSGSAWTSDNQKVIRDLGLQPCMENAGVQIRSSVDNSAIKYGDVSLNRSSNNLPAGERYWKYVLIHMDDFLIASQETKCIM